MHMNELCAILHTAVMACVTFKRRTGTHIQCIMNALEAFPCSMKSMTTRIFGIEHLCLLSNIRITAYRKDVCLIAHIRSRTTPVIIKSIGDYFPGASNKRRRLLSIIDIEGGTQIFYKDWGTGQPILFCHGWPLNSDSWESQMMFFASRGFRCIAHDRRGHGRSTQCWNGNDMDTYADDLSALIETLDLKNILLVGFSAGGGEAVRYLARHGSKRVSMLALIGAVPPLMLKTPANPDGLPMASFDKIRAASSKDRSQSYLDIASGPFFGANRPESRVTQGMIDTFWLQGMQAGARNTYECIKAFSETDFTEDLKKINLPALVIHGDDDQIVPIGASSQCSAKLLKNSTLKIYRGAPHGLPYTHHDKINADLLEFFKSPNQA